MWKTYRLPIGGLEVLVAIFLCIIFGQGHIHLFIADRDM